MCFTSVVFGRKKESPGPVNVVFAWECAAQIHTHVYVHTPTCVCILQGVSQSQRERLTSVKEVKKCLVTYQKVLHALLALKHCTLWKVFHSGTFFNQLGLLSINSNAILRFHSYALSLSLSISLYTDLHTTAPGQDFVFHCAGDCWEGRLLTICSWGNTYDAR